MLLQKHTDQYPDVSMEFLKDWKLLLIDDDGDFRSFMEAIISSTLIRIKACGSLKDLPSVQEIKRFDAIIMDYYLEKLSGVQLAQYIRTISPHTPIILTSASALCQDNEEWPDSIKSFISKDRGPYEIIRETLSVLQNSY